MAKEGARYNTKTKEENRKDLISDDVREAEKLGLSTGLYIEYKKSGYLWEYMKQKAIEDELYKNANVIESHIGGGGGGGVKRTHFMAEKF